MSKLNLGALFESKKFKVFAASQLAVGLVYLASYAGLDPEVAKVVAPDVAKWLVILAAAYLGGQGIADIGKGKEQLTRAEAHAGATTTLAAADSPPSP